MVLNLYMVNILVDLIEKLTLEKIIEKLKLFGFMKDIIEDISKFKGNIRILPNPKSSGINYFWTRNGLRKNKIRKIWKTDGIV